MEDESIIGKIERAMEAFFHEDLWLAEKNLSERSIAHRIAYHLTPLFEGLQVDCEYNGDIDNPTGRKVINVLRDQLNELNRLRENDPDEDDGIVSKSVFPDIIVHSRGNNDNNLCAIEIKKSSNTTDFRYDQLKLQAYTSKADGNLGYQLGVFLEIKVAHLAPGHRMNFFKDGVSIS